DPEGKDDADRSTGPAGARYYQLTHDYLVPSLRDWLTRKQKETRRGRAGRAAAGGSGGRLECSAGEPPVAVAGAMAANPLADADEALDAAAAPPDASRRPLSRRSWHPGRRGPGAVGAGRLVDAWGVAGAGVGGHRACRPDGRRTGGRARPGRVP